VEWADFRTDGGIESCSVSAFAADPLGEFRKRRREIDEYLGIVPAESCEDMTA
jgi:hypothetical protein